VDIYVNDTYGQYRDPSSEKHQKRRKKKNVGKKQLFGRNKTKKLVSTQDPFVTKSKKTRKGNIKEPLFMKGQGKGKIKEKDAFVIKQKNKSYSRRGKGKRKKDKKNGIVIYDAKPKIVLKPRISLIRAR
jgi:hypothetical protein